MADKQPQAKDRDHKGSRGVVCASECRAEGLLATLSETSCPVPESRGVRCPLFPTAHVGKDIVAFIVNKLHDNTTSNNNNNSNNNRGSPPHIGSQAASW